MLTPTTTREGYTLDELQLVIRWVLATWRRRGDSLPKPANICRINRFDGYLADAEAWAVLEANIDPEAVMNGYNEIFADVLPAAELDADRRRMITRLAAHMKIKLPVHSWGTSKNSALMLLIFISVQMADGEPALTT